MSVSGGTDSARKSTRQSLVEAVWRLRIVGEAHLREDIGMRSYNRAKTLIDKGQTAVMLFTRGANFRIGRGGRRAWTGDWNLNARRAGKAHWVLIYLQGRGGAALFRGRNAGLTKRGERWRV